MRCTQTFGLNERGLNFIEENAKRTPEKICAHCGHREGGDVIFKDSGETCGMFDEINLRQIELKNGRIVEEFVQFSPWSSGPMEFYALRYKGTKEEIEETLWTIEEAEYACSEKLE